MQPEFARRTLRIEGDFSDFDVHHGLRSLGFGPDHAWTPLPITMNGNPVVFFNMFGIIFYSDDLQLAAAAKSVNLQNLGSFVRQRARKVSPLIPENAVRASVNNVAALATVGLAAALGATLIVRLFWVPNIPPQVLVQVYVCFGRSKPRRKLN
jgi:hypothetical protein